MMKVLPERFLLLFGFLVPTLSCADVPVELNAVDIPNVVESQPDDAFLVVHYTSSMASCGYCDRNNAHFREAVQDLEEYANFAEVITNPWQAFRSQIELISYHSNQGLEMVGMPLVVVYQNGAVVWHIYGEQPKLATLLGMGLITED